MAKNKTVIHRNRTFEYDGAIYRVLGGGRGTINEVYGYEVVTEDYDQVADGFFDYDDIRQFVDQARENGWPLVEQKGWV